MNTYDMDGVVFMGDYEVGLVPTEYDVIITGRSFEEREYTMSWLNNRGICCPVFFNSLPFDEKTRESSGLHKANTLNWLIELGHEIGFHYEDDPIQAEIIRQNTPVRVVELHHDFVEKENVWHGK